jgi:peroxiredoxin Q/BCP
MLTVGDAAPDFELLSDEGRPVRLSDLRGRRVVLFFYPKADTPGCTRQACGFRDSFPRISAAQTTIFGISPDQPAALAKWRAKEKLPYNLLSDPDHRVIAEYGAWGPKTSYGITRDGVIRSHVVVGPDGRIEDLQLKVSPEESVQRALEAIAGRTG